MVHKQKRINAQGALGGAAQQSRADGIPQSNV